MSDFQPKDNNNFLLSFLLIVYIIIKYPIKFCLLFYLFSCFLYYLKEAWSWICKTIGNMIKAFKKLTNAGTIDLILIKIPNLFVMFMAFIDLFIGLIYLCISIFFIIIAVLFTIPFNLTLSL